MVSADHTDFEKKGCHLVKVFFHCTTTIVFEVAYVYDSWPCLLCMQFNSLLKIHQEMKTERHLLLCMHLISKRKHQETIIDGCASALRGKIS